MTTTVQNHMGYNIQDVAPITYPSRIIWTNDLGYNIEHFAPITYRPESSGPQHTTSSITYRLEWSGPQHKTCRCSRSRVDSSQSFHKAGRHPPRTPSAPVDNKVHTYPKILAYRVIRWYITQYFNEKKEFNVSKIKSTLNQWFFFFFQTALFSLWLIGWFFYTS